MSVSENVVLSEIGAGGVATVTLNRPEVFNGYNAELLSALRQTAERLDADDDVRMIVLRGAGKHFSAGADVNWFRELAGGSAEEQLDAARLSAHAMRALYALSKPSLALIHNACFGGGTGYAAACDIVVASEDARFSITEVRLGITAAPILPELVAAIGPRQMRRYALTGETFDAAAAHRIGLVHEICPVGGLDEAAKPIIDALLRSAPNAVRETKALITDVAGTAISESKAENMAAISGRGRGSDEAVEGFTAFFDKRPPNWYPGGE
jgi:methylglutaconyl-CoA hydratase